MSQDHDIPDPHTLYVFTDGSAYNNGKATCTGGTGVVFMTCVNGKSDVIYTKNSALPRDDPTTPTNNRAELYAILYALRKLRRYVLSPDITHIEFVCDSNLCVRTFNEWLPTWMMNGWRGANNKPIANQDILRRIRRHLYNLKSRYPSVTFTHVRAHTKGTDWRSEGNRIADSLASHRVS